MAESSSFCSWGTPITGRETKGLEVFQEALGFFARLKGAGTIEDFRVGLTNQGNSEQLSGYLIVEGSKAAMAALAENREYLNLVDRAVHVVHSFMIVGCDTGTAISARIERILAARKQLGIA
jgi:hypothetical protein